MVENFAYVIQCGCAEAEGRTCTVNRGTKLVWSFADSEEHNVSSDSSQVADSTDLLSGTFEFTFRVDGIYDYRCTLHPAEMSDYQIIVK